MIAPPPGFVFVCLHRGRGLISRLIQWQTRGKYSHASLVLPDGSHVEAREFAGVNRYRQFTAPKGEVIDIFAVRVGDFALSAIERRVARELGSKYDYRSVVAFLTRTMPKSESVDRWFCSEFVVALVEEEGGIELFRDTKPWEVSPALLGRSPVLTHVRTIIGEGLPLAA